MKHLNKLLSYFQFMTLC